MYRCEACNVPVQPNTPSRRIVVETRPKNYHHRKDANRLRIAGKKKPLFTDDPGGAGWEIVKEIKVCRTCYEKMAAERTPGAPPSPAEEQPAG